jgi:hypothetical protein
MAQAIKLSIYSLNFTIHPAKGVDLTHTKISIVIKNKAKNAFVKV